MDHAGKRWVASPRGEKINRLKICDSPAHLFEPDFREALSVRFCIRFSPREVGGYDTIEPLLPESLLREKKIPEWQ
jgi:hypothetical protein